jgi:hypothetical protein
MKKEQELVLSIVNFLTSHHILSDYDAYELYDMFRESKKETFVEFLLDEGIVDTSELLDALQEFYELEAFDVNGHFFDHHLLHMFPKDVMLRNSFIPLERDENMLIVIVSHPENDDLLEIIGEHVSYDVRFMVGLAHDIHDAVKEFYDDEPNVILQDEDLQAERRLANQEKQMESSVVDVDQLEED